MKSITRNIFFFNFLFFYLQSNAQAPYWNWAATAGGNNSDRANAITYSHDGNILVAGYFQDTAQFGVTTLATVPDGLFLARYSKNGSLIWANKIATADNGVEAQKIFEDSTGNIFITGYFGDLSVGGNIDFVSGPSYISNGGRDFFVAKFQSNGNLIWAKQLGSFEDDKIASTITEKGIVIQGARFSDFIAGSDTVSDTLFSDFSWHLWILSYNVNGQIQFLSDIVSNASQLVPTGIVDDTMNNYYLSGNYYGHPAVGFYPDTTWLSDAGGSTNIYLLKFHFDTSGMQKEWQQFIGGAGNDYSHAMDMNEHQEILLTGIYVNSGYFGNDSGSVVLNSVNPGNENFIGSYQSNGNLLFAKNAGYSVSGGIISTAIIHDDSLIYICGKYTGAPVFGEGADTFSLVPVKNFFVCTYNDTGTFHWARGSVSSFIDGLNAITLDDSGHVYVAGYFTFYCEIDTGVTDSLYLTSYGVDDIFVGRLGYKIAIEDTVIIDTTLVQNLFENNSLSIYPNPATDYLNIDLNNFVCNSSFEIFSVNGKIILEQKLSNNTKKIFLNTSNLMNGIYFIRVSTADKMLNGKFTIVREE